MILAGLQAFARTDLAHRFLHGGLPPFCLAQTLDAQLQTRAIHYWRDKRGHEIDFVLTRRKQGPAAIGCKWSALKFEASNLKIFRKHYPKGDNWSYPASVDSSTFGV